MTSPPRLAIVTDRGLLGPALLALASALHCTPRAEVLFVAHELDPSALALVEQVVASRPGSLLVLRELAPEDLREGTSPKSFITKVALGRLLLPRIAAEQGWDRLLYLDADTLVRRDLSPLFSLDLGGLPLAGVPDYSTLRRMVHAEEHKLPVNRQVVGRNPLWSYVNSGVLLLDIPAIHAQPGLVAAMEDLRAAQGFPTVDQDRINLLFAGRHALLDPAWNASWGRLRKQRRDLARVGATPLLATGGEPAVLHFHGPNKPWRRINREMLKRGALATLTYRRALAAFLRRFPDAPFT